MSCMLCSPASTGCSFCIMAGVYRRRRSTGGDPGSPQVAEIYMGQSYVETLADALESAARGPRDLETFYGDFQALFGVSLEVARGEAVAASAPTAPAKSTLLKSIAGLIRATVRRDHLRRRADRRHAERCSAARGIALVPEGRGLFPSLTVEENLRIGGQLGRPGAWTLGRVYELFPALGERPQNCRARRSPAGSSRWPRSGRALMANPQLLLCG